MWQLAEASVNHLILPFNELNASDFRQVMEEARWFAEELLPSARALPSRPALG